MKTKITFILCAVLFVFGALTAQTNQPPTPNDYKSWLVPIKGYSDSTAVKYYTGRVDTIAYTYHATAKYVLTYFPYVGCNYLSFTIDLSDTGNVGVVVKSRVRTKSYGAAGSWATTLTDSLVNSGASASSGLVKEFSLKDYDSDLFDGLDQEFMIIVTHSAWGDNDTQGTARRRVRLNWK